MSASEQHQPGVEGSPQIGPMKPVGEIFVEFLSIIAKRKRPFAMFVVGVTLIAIVVSAVLPKWYKATSTVFPAESADLFSGLSGLSSLVSSISPVKKLSSLTGGSELDRYTAILKSQRALTAVIEKFDLVKVYNITSYTHEKTVKELMSNIDIQQSDEGSLEVSVYDKDPRRAAEMANYFVKMLNEINSELHVQNASANRVFIEQRYQKNLSDIESSQEEFKNFQLKTGVVSVPEQVEASIKVAADLYAQMNLKEIELAILERTVSSKHPSYNEKLFEVQELKKKLHDMNEGPASAAGDMNILLPFKLTPALGAEYLHRYRNVEIQYKILQFITPLYEQAKVEENRSTPSVVILDHATVPEMKAKPKIMLYALLAFVSSSMLGLFAVFLLEARDKVRRMMPDQYAVLSTLLRKDWFKDSQNH